ncbi:MAG: class I SAM-dependent methyltransferase [Candidatus Zixiibacteriota bacterium]
MDDATRRTIRYYDAYGPQMDARMAKRDYTKLYDLFCKDLPDGTVLDIGCGSGRHLREFKERGLTAIGIEPSTTLRDLALQAGHTVHDATIAGLPSLALPPLAGIWCAAVIHHIPKAEAYSAIRQFHQMLMPNGRLFITTRLGDWSGWEKHDESDTEERFIQLFEENELIEEFEVSGFTMLHRETEQSYWSRPLPWLNCIAERR